jgi:acetyl esterase/lipase
MRLDRQKKRRLSRIFRPQVSCRLESRLVPSGYSLRRPVAVLAERRLSVALQSAEVHRDIVYRSVAGNVQTLDVLSPDGPRPAGGRPVILAIHGGGWRKGSNRSYERIVAPLVNRGFIVVAPNYRLSRAGSPSWPIVLDELRDAVRWTRTHANEIGADPSRIAAMGESAGGHLAAILGTYPEPSGTAVSSRVQAVVDFYGPTDLAALDATSRKARLPIRQFLGGPPSTIPSSYADASPIRHVSPDDPPTLIVQGSADDLVLPSQSVGLARALGHAGVTNQLVIVRGVGHGFSLNAGGLDLARIVAGFLTSAMG